VHLLARLPSRELRSPEGKVLKNRLFEIQIRSLLEHAWAEFEHAIVYKSGINFPKDVKRTFSQLAGALELLDGNFLALRDQSDALVEKYVQELKARTLGRNRPLDVATLVAALEYERPSGYGWRLARQRNQPFIPGTEVSALQALRRVNIRTLAGLHAALRARRLQQRIIKYAGAKTIPPEQVAHWVVVALVVGLRKPDTLRNFFPELLTDPEIVRTLA
jgi:hypothetical protein